MSQEEPTKEFSHSLEAIAKEFKENVEVKDRKYRLSTYKECFVGSEAVDYICASGMAESRSDAVELGRALAVNYNLFEHVTRDHEFQDDYKFYKFIEPGKRGAPKLDDGGKAVHWANFLAPDQPVHEDLRPSFPLVDFENIPSKDQHVASHVWPLDEHNTTLLNHVHPPDWQDPTAHNQDGSSTYDLIAIGGGTAGLITAAGAAGVGAKAALVEEHMLGGDCLNVGCVPSKAIIHSANLAHTLQNTEHLQEAGISLDRSMVKVDFEKVMERVRKVRAEISHHDSATRYSTELGVEIYIGRAVFTSENSLQVNGRTLYFKRAVIATGGYPTLIPMPGLKELHDKATSPQIEGEARPQVMTNETVFNLTKKPENMVVVGAGVIGMELAQAMQRLGSNVAVLGRSGKVLPKEDADLAELVKDQMEKDGVAFHLSVAEYKNVELTGRVLENGYPELKITVSEKGKESDTEFLCDALLIAAGRRPNVTGMDLEAAKVEYDCKTGVKVSDRLQTSNPRIFAAGDCCSVYKFTHAADFMARIVIKNALFFGKEKMSNLIIPYATFTQPEIASVGLYEKDLKEKGIAFRIVEKHFKDNDRSICDNSTIGMIRYRVDGKTDKILGATIIGEGAGNLIGEVTLAMQSDTGLLSLASVIHPYPTKSEVLRQGGDILNKTRLTLTVKKLLRGIVALQR